MVQCVICNNPLYLHKNKKKKKSPNFLEAKDTSNFLYDTKMWKDTKTTKKLFKIFIQNKFQPSNLAYMIYMNVISINFFIIISLKVNWNLIIFKIVETRKYMKLTLKS
jgi:hypothetical protein